MKINLHNWLGLVARILVFWGKDSVDVLGEWSEDIGKHIYT